MTSRDVRRMEPRDYPTILELNAANVEFLSPLTLDRLTWIHALAAESLVGVIGDEVVAYAVIIAPDTAYDSANYAWFEERYEDFLYLDRLVVAAPFRGQGWGALLHQYLAELAQLHQRVVCEVNHEPPNLVSLNFHQRLGFVVIDYLAHRSGLVTAMLSRELR